MPTNVVRTPEQERLWNKAKRLAEKQGRAKDWQYVMGIFKQMGGLEKSFAVPAPFRLMRTPGQVPSRERLEAMKTFQELERMPKSPGYAELVRNDSPRLNGSSAVDGLGFDAQAVDSWGRFLEKTVGVSPNELVLRQAVVSQTREARLQPELRQAILDRALSYWRTVRKSMVEVVTVDELRKAEDPEFQKADPRGGNYHRRVPQAGGYRYYYNPADYAKRQDVHVDGREARRGYLRGKVHKAIESKGEQGCGPEDLAELAKQFSPDEVKEVLSDREALECKKGRYYLRAKSAVAKALQPKSLQPKLVLTRR